MKIMTPSERKKHFRKHRRTKLSEKDIKEIRFLWKGDTRQKVIAKKFKVTPGYISRILSGQVWTHV